MFHVTYCLLKIIYLTLHHLKLSIKNNSRKIWLFSHSKAIHNIIKKHRARSKASTSKRRRSWLTKRLCKSMACTIVFSAMKHPSTFLNSKDFGIWSVTALIYNCAPATIFNEKSLFVGKSTPTKYFSLLTVGSNDYRPTHYGAGVISINADDGSIKKFLLKMNCIIQLRQ